MFSRGMEDGGWRKGGRGSTINEASGIRHQASMIKTSQASVVWSMIEQGPVAAGSRVVHAQGMPHVNHAASPTSIMRSASIMWNIQHVEHQSCGASIMWSIHHVEMHQGLRIWDLEGQVVDGSRLVHAQDMPHVHCTSILNPPTSLLNPQSSIRNPRAFNV
eukprot:2685503-Rhodomonas_salina.2